MTSYHVKLCQKQQVKPYLLHFVNKNKKTGTNGNRSNLHFRKISSGGYTNHFIEQHRDDWDKKYSQIFEPVMNAGQALEMRRQFSTLEDPFTIWHKNRKWIMFSCSTAHIYDPLM